MKVALYTLGCKLNQAETESLARDLHRAGFQLVPRDAVADVYVANTCTVTHVADRKSRQWLRQARRKNPHALVIATGCYAQRSRTELASLADIIVDNPGKNRLVEIIRGGTRSPSEIVSSARAETTAGERRAAHGRQDTSQWDCEIPFDNPSSRHPLTEASGTGRIRSLVKIQEGCESHCAYCIVPLVRPREYSLPADHILAEIRERVAEDYQEVVLTGTNVGRYGDNDTRLHDLIRQILEKTDIKRLRLSSLQPSELSRELCALWEDRRLCRHFHLALQSGSDAVLRLMGRRYTIREYQRTVELIGANIPDAAITTDVIVGFPGETSQQFEESYSFCRQAAFATIHVFPFSDRPGTPAARMPDRVKDGAKQERTQRMLELSRACQQSFRRRFLGRSMSVLWERETTPGSGTYSGLTDNYIRVFAQSDRSLINKTVRTRLLGLAHEGMSGEVDPDACHRSE